MSTRNLAISKWAISILIGPLTTPSFAQTQNRSYRPLIRHPQVEALLKHLPTHSQPIKRMEISMGKWKLDLTRREYRYRHRVRRWWRKVGSSSELKLRSRFDAASGLDLRLEIAFCRLICFLSSLHGAGRDFPRLLLIKRIDGYQVPELESKTSVSVGCKRGGGIVVHTWSSNQVPGKLVSWYF